LVRLEQRIVDQVRGVEAPLEARIQLQPPGHHLQQLAITTGVPLSHGGHLSSGRKRSSNDSVRSVELGIILIDKDVLRKKKEFNLELTEEPTKESRPRCPPGQRSWRVQTRRSVQGEHQGALILVP